MHIENIKVGDHLIVVGRCGQSSYELTEHDECYGGPLRVRAVSAPYVAISDVREPKRVRTLDLRLWSVSKVEDEYVKAFDGAEFEPEVKASSKEFSHSCPICREGRFVKVFQSGKEPYWRCSVCSSVIIEESCQS